MSEENKYKNFTAVDIEKYHKRLLSPKEMNELEKAALDDPLLADALEGYGNMPVNFSADMKELEKKLEQRVSKAKMIPIAPVFTISKFLKVAAVVVFVAGSAFLIYQLTSNHSPQSVAVEKNRAPQSPVKTDTNDQSSIVTNNKQVEKEQTKKSDTRTIKPATGKISTTISTSANGLVVTPPQSSNETKAKREIVRNENADIASRSKTDSLKTVNSNNQANGYSAMVANNQIKKDQADDRKFKQSQPASVIASPEMSNQVYRKSAAFDKNVATNYFYGRVVDYKNNGLPFANISNVKDNVGTYADAQGNFTLISTDSILDLRVKSVGFITDTVQLHGNLKGFVTNNNVVLKEDNDKGLTLGGKRQAKIPSPEENIKVEESEPEDGWSNYNLYVANNIKIPDDIGEKQLHQEVKLSFEINKLGEPVDIKIEKSNCKVCDEEAVRLVKEGPKWKPKKKKSRVTLTIPF